MFILKKLITPFLLPPGLFVIMLMMAGFWLWRRQLKKQALVGMAMALLLWAVSIGPVSHALLKGLEDGLSLPSKVQGDVIILLGGGIHEDVPDLTGRGTPGEDMLARMVTAIRLHRRLNIPIIISGGAVYAGRTPEATIVKRFLTDLGVDEKQILLESRSRDTQENALFCREIVQQRHFNHPLLVTSAYHMQRSLFLFQAAGLTVTPVPAQFLTSRTSSFIWVDMLPTSEAFVRTSVALKEYLGLLFYRLVATLKTTS